MSDVISPPSATGARGRDLPAYLSNGLIGLRVREDSLTPGLCIVSGFVGEHHERRVEAAAPGPYPLGLDVALDGLWASGEAGAVEPLDQTYDFATGELTTRVRLRVGDATAVVETVAFCSRTHPTLVCERIRATPEGSHEVQVRPRVAIAALRGKSLERRLDTPGEPEPAADGTLLWESEGGAGRLGVALSTSAREQAARTQEPWDEQGPLSTTWSFPRVARPASVDRLVSLVPEVMHAQPHRQALRLVAPGAELGFDELRRRNRAAWEDLWKGRIRLVGADRKWQALADAGLFYLNSSVHRASPSSTSIYGLATWIDYHYYFGHVMWDVDAFAVPPLSLLQPEAARAMLDYRTRCLPAARMNARLQGRVGLQFPWESGPRAGEETSPGAGSAAVREVHVNLHVARAFALHADATGDPRFLADHAWPVLEGVCDWIVDRVTPTRDGFRFEELGGPAENPGFIDEDALTTLTARTVLRRTVRAAEQLGRPTPARWAEVADGLRPVIRSDGAVASHADFRVDEPKGATPGPLMAIFPVWAEMDATTRERTLAFYLAHWRDYVGSPMLAALYGTWAAWAGDRDLALKLFDEGYAKYQTGRFAQTLEYRLDKIGGVASGPFFANIGGFVTGLLTGLPRLRVSDADPATWAQDRVVLPTGWTAIECDRVWIRGEPWRLVARHGERAELTPA
jgi:protein-glucosylgalactosylhydroxylysine glucosidase